MTQRLGSRRGGALATATLFGVVGAAMAGAIWWISLPPDEWVALVERNPGWAVADGTIRSSPSR